MAKATRIELRAQLEEMGATTTANQTKGALLRLLRKAVTMPTTPEDNELLGFGKHGHRTFKATVVLDPDYCKWVTDIEDETSGWRLRRFAAWLRGQRVAPP
eukprot:12612260-Alexandrium_andersonii.AAC.1